MGMGPAGARGRLHRRPIAVRCAAWSAILLAFAATSHAGPALGQTATAAAIVSDVPVAGGTERALFLGGRQARAIVLLLPGGDGIIGLDSGGGRSPHGYLGVEGMVVQRISEWIRAAGGG